MHSQKDGNEVFEDHTVKTGGNRILSDKSGPISPGPSASPDEDLSKEDKSSGKGFAGVPGAGPNPTR